MECFSILLMLAGAVACILILVARLAVRKSLSRRSWVTVVMAFVPILILIGAGIRNSKIEYNPNGVTPNRIVGHYSKGDLWLSLNGDGTYASSSIEGLAESGAWSNFDWNLTFSDSQLEQPRWITKSGRPFILPYYSGPDGSDGLALKKERE